MCWSARERMTPITDRYVTYWVDRLGREAMSRVIATSRDDDRVWAWYVGREAELATLAESERRHARAT